MADDSIHYRCLLAVQARIQGLLLEGIAAENVVLQKLPFLETNASLPRILLSHLGKEDVSSEPGTNLRDDIGYPVVVSIIAADNLDQQQNASQYLLWRERISQAFRHQRLAEVPEVWTCRIEPRQVTTSDAFSHNVYHSSLTLRFFSRESRG
jgi:hypothetical protein